MNHVDLDVNLVRVNLDAKMTTRASAFHRCRSDNTSSTIHLVTWHLMTLLLDVHVRQYISVAALALGLDVGSD